MVIAPELADVLSAIISRLRSHSRSGTVPLVPAYDSQERTWLPPARLADSIRTRRSPAEQGSSPT